MVGASRSAEKTDFGDTVYLLKKGRVKIYKLLANGEGLTQEVIETGDIFGEGAFDDEPRDTIAETLDDSLIYVMRRRDFELFLKKKPDLAMRLTRFAPTRRRHIQNRLDNLAFRTVSSRLAFLLLFLADGGGVHNSNGMELRVKLSRGDLAKLTGTAQETISDLLNELKRLNIIEAQGRRIRPPESVETKEDCRCQDAGVRDINRRRRRGRISLMFPAIT